MVVQQEDRRAGGRRRGEESGEFGDEVLAGQDGALPELEMVARVGAVATVALVGVLGDDCEWGEVRSDSYSVRARRKLLP